MHEIDFYGKKLNAYKSSLHNHSTTSDGIYAPDDIIGLYQKQGYDVFAFTDHRITNPVSTYDGRGMTLISGMEMHPWGPRAIPWHLVALGVPEDFVFPLKEDAQGAVDAAKATGAAVFCAHPVWCGLTSEDVATLKNLDGIEVYNRCCEAKGRAYNMQLWDELSSRGLVYPALAVDDAHNSFTLFKGMTYVIAEDKSPTSVLDALKNGRLYASQGPVFTRVSLVDGVFEAEFSPCTEVIGMTNPSGGYCVEIEDLRGYGSGTREITSAKISLLQSDAPLWFRLQIKDAAGRYAWSAPIVY